MKHRIAFHSYQLGKRGTEVHLYKIAKYNQEVLGNESIIISTSSRPTPTLEMFEKEFKVILYSDVWLPDRANICLRKKLENIVDNEKITHFWAIKGGESDGFMPTNTKRLVQCVFNMSEPHGEVYSGICEYISIKYGGKFPWVYPIVEKDAPHVIENFREKLNIPKDALVLGRHGGNDTFSITFVKNVIANCLEKRKDLHFVFLSTDKFIDHPRVHHLDYVIDLEEKAKFINTCDAMIHARSDGEIFSLAIADFSTRNKPIITWKPKIPPSQYDLGHMLVLGENAIYYENEDELMNIIINISKYDINKKNWDVYGDTYSPKNIMKDFKKTFLD